MKKYTNGNLITFIDDSNGTKIHYTKDDEFLPSFPENMDITISTKCSNGCKWCYAGCSIDGKYADFDKYRIFLNSIHPFTEVALNVQSPVADDVFGDCSTPSTGVIPYLASRDVFVNITINQSELSVPSIVDDIQRSLLNDVIKGVGISIGGHATDEAIEFLKTHSSSVAHVIAGVTDEESIENMADAGIKILVLGYKTTHRGIDYIEDNSVRASVNSKIKLLSDTVMSYRNRFACISFDNLALDQLGMKDKIGNDEWELLYQGEEGSFTFAADLVSGEFAVSSTDYDYGHVLEPSMTVDDVFSIVRTDAIASHRN